MKNYKLPDAKENNQAMKQWKENMMEEKRKSDYEKFLREQMEFEEARRIRELNRIWHYHNKLWLIVNHCLSRLQPCLQSRFCLPRIGFS